MPELDARTTNTMPALYVPEKLKRRERQIADGHCTRLRAREGGNKKPLHRKSERSGFLLRRNAPRSQVALKGEGAKAP
ncbi:hypothetical protein PQR71_05560 [Paraburkholderia fungorum]|uniref:hypothetical protein n=1 Tax=Paraburkholderia fungorum TaxID=134537 RepID=UPI0038BC4D92